MLSVREGEPQTECSLPFLTRKIYRRAKQLDSTILNHIILTADERYVVNVCDICEKNGVL
jgi:hypothetical protein